MNGAIAEPSVSTISSAIRPSTSRIGASHHFLRTLRNSQNSFASSAMIFPPILHDSELSLHGASGIRVSFPFQPIRSPVPQPAMQRVPTHEAHQHPSGCYDEEVDKAQQDPGVKPSQRVRPLH